MKTVVLAGFAAVFSVALAGQSQAKDLPQSVTYEHSSVRMLAGKSDKGTWTAGVEISLGPGWKTYWRIPGDAGVPPYFDWNGSENLARVDLEWPAPKRYNDEAGESIGYKDNVVFPLTVTPADPAKPVNLRLELFYAVCNDICIPGKAKLALTLNDPAGQPDDLAAIEGARSKIPSHSGTSLKIDNVALEEYGSGFVLSVALAGAQSQSDTDIFVEGADDLYFRKPKLMSAAAGSKVYHLQIDGLKKAGDLKGQALTLTVVAKGTAVASQTILK
ncbi:MAG: protein-disulfide reductase DsbD domain-containing protein [Aestuariivirgaceae bacterium]